MNEDNTTSFATSDIVLASTLKINGYELDSIEKIGNKGSFRFNGVDKEFLQDYDLGKLRVEPSTFNNAVRALTTSVKRLLEERR